MRETKWKYLKERYAAVIHAIHLEWIFLQHVTKNTGDVFTGVEKLVWEKMCASPFHSKVKISLNPHRNSKYITGQEIRPGPPESREVCRQKISKF